MKKNLIFIFLIFFLVACKAKGLSSYQKWDELNDLRKHEVSSLAYDLRPYDACLAGHIPNFTCLYYNQEPDLIKTKDNIVSVYDKKALILLICEDGKNSSLLADMLIKAGFTRVYYYLGGYNKYCEDNKAFIPEIGCNC